MRCSEANTLLDRQITEIEVLRGKPRDGGRFNAWERETRIIIARIFGEKSPHIATFENIRYSPGVSRAGGGRDYEEERTYWNKGCNEADAFLKVLKDEIERDRRFGSYQPKARSEEVDAEAKITLLWLARHLPASFVFIAVGALISAFLLGIQAGQIEWVQKLFEK